MNFYYDQVKWLLVVEAPPLSLSELSFSPPLSFRPLHKNEIDKFPIFFNHYEKHSFYSVSSKSWSTLEDCLSLFFSLWLNLDLKPSLWVTHTKNSELEKYFPYIHQPFWLHASSPITPNLNKTKLIHRQNQELVRAFKNNKRLSHCLNLFLEVMRSSSSELLLETWVIIIEVLFASKYEIKHTHSLGKRLASFLAHSRNEEENIFSTFIAIYEVRSKLTHGQLFKKEILFDMLLSLESLIKSIFRALFHPKNGTWEKFDSESPLRTNHLKYLDQKSHIN